MSSPDPTEEGLELRDNGTVVLWAAGARLRLRRPKIREYLLLVEALEEARDHPEGRQAVDLAEAWLRLTFDLLGDHPLPPPEELPAWVVASGVVTDLVSHWQTKPDSPWRQLGEGETAPARRPGPRSVRDEVGVLYNKLAEAMFPPNVVDELELWQVAALASDPDEAGADAAQDPRRGRQPQAPPSPTRDPLLEARVRARRGEGPPPEAEATPLSIVQALNGPG